MKDCCGEGLLGANIPQVTCPNFKNVWQVWQGPLEGGAYVAVVVNRCGCKIGEAGDLV